MWWLVTLARWRPRQVVCRGSQKWQPICSNIANLTLWRHPDRFSRWPPPRRNAVRMKTSTVGSASCLWIYLLCQRVLFDLLLFRRNCQSPSQVPDGSAPPPPPRQTPTRDFGCHYTERLRKLDFDFSFSSSTTPLQHLLLGWMINMSVIFYLTLYSNVNRFIN